MPEPNGSDDADFRDQTSLSRRLRITPEELRDRLAFLGFGAEDRRLLPHLADVIRDALPELIDEFYRHLLQFDPMQRLLTDPARLDRLKQAQREYLLSLGELPDRPDYVERRLRIGLTHERVGLDQKWYLGAYSTMFALIVRRLAAQNRQDADRLAAMAVTLEKLFKLDQTLVVDVYHHAATERLAASLDELRETHRQLEEVYRLDALTHVLNRRSLMDTLDTELERSRRYHRPFALLFLDVDHFKAINDRHGHTRGDIVLQWLVQLIARMLRPPDILGRYGGEEFAIGLIECDEQRANTIAERIRAGVAQAACEADAQMIPVTVSIGVSLLSPSAQGVEDLLKEADVALYQAKARGRNRVETYRPATGTGPPAH
ncbi:MAG: diguanylate cyclase [Nitrospiraceae bacterium]|nr:diguanylate cyclase [Nitrospiraceae bacterium]